jgi:hypothetical protein
MSKVCRHCKKSKLESEFGKKKSGELNSACIQCCEEYKEKQAGKKSGSTTGAKPIKGPVEPVKAKQKKLKAYQMTGTPLKGEQLPLPSPRAVHVKRKGGMGSRRGVAEEVNKDLEAKAVEFLHPILVGNLNKLPNGKRFKEFQGSLHAANEEYKATYGTFPRTVYQYKDRFFLQEPPAVEAVIIQKETSLKKVTKKATVVVGDLMSAKVKKGKKNVKKSA